MNTPLIHNHLDYTENRLLADAKEADCVNEMVAGVLFDKVSLNVLLAEIEPDQVWCYTAVMGAEMHAAYRVFHGHSQTDFVMQRCPLLSHDQALGEAIRLWEEHGCEENDEQ